MSRTIHILTIRDQSDFGAVKYQSAHTSEQAAREHAQLVGLPEVQANTDPEWHYALEASVRPMEFFE